MVWSIMKNQLHDYEPQLTNKEELEKALLEIWLGIPQTKIDESVATFHYRFEMCNQTLVGCISYLLSAGRKRVKDTDKIDREHTHK